MQGNVGICWLGCEAQPPLAWGVLCCHGWGPSVWEACGHPSLLSHFPVPYSFLFASAGVGSKLMTALPMPQEADIAQNVQEDQTLCPRQYSLDITEQGGAGAAEWGPE